MACEMMMGLSFLLMSSQYSRASMLTLRWSIPSWQMSACNIAALRWRWLKLSQAAERRRQDKLIADLQERGFAFR